MAKQAEETDPQTAAALAGLSIESLLHDYDGRDGRDIFAKVHAFTLAEQARAVHLYPFFQPLDRNDGPEAEIYGRRVLMLGYLQLLQYQNLMTALLLTFVVVMAVDYLSAQLRALILPSMQRHTRRASLLAGLTAAWR